MISSLETLKIKNVRARIAPNGLAELHIEDVARGLGFVQERNNVEYVRWERVNKYLEEFSFPTCGENSFIPENIFYKLCFKANNATAMKFQSFVTDEVLPTIRKHGAYLTPETLKLALQDPQTVINLATQLLNEQQEKEHLKQELDYSKEWYSIKRVANLNGVSHKRFDWRRLKQASLNVDRPPKKIFDANYGEVNTYHKTAWEKAYPKYEL